MRIAGGWAIGVLACVLGLSCSESADVAPAGGAGTGADASTGGAGGAGGTAGSGGTAGAAGADGGAAGDAGGEDGGTEAKCAALKTKIETVVADGGGPGFALAIAQNGQVTCQVTLGNLKPNNPIASVVKSTTLFRNPVLGTLLVATLALRLVEEGKLDLDEPISTYIPELALDDDPNGWLAQVTTRHLLTTSSGFHPANNWPQAGSTADEALADSLTSGLFASQQYIEYEPGTVPEWFSNTGVVVLGLVVERAAGMPLRNALKEKILQPLGMTRTYYLSADFPDTDVATLTSPQSYFDAANVAPLGGPASSIEDFVRFAQFFLAGDTSVLSDALRTQAISPQLNEQVMGDHCQWGFSWLVEDSLCWFGPKQYYDLGATTMTDYMVIGGGRAFAMLVPQWNAAVMWQSHAAPQISHLDILGPALEFLGEGPLQPQSHPPDSSTFGDYVGTYQGSDKNPTVTISMPADTLHMSWTASGAHECDLVPGQVPRGFTCDDATMGDVWFYADDQGQVTHIATGSFVIPKAAQSDADAGSGDAN